MQRRLHSDRAPQLSTGSNSHCFSFLAALALGLIVSAVAQAGSASATLQVRARIVTSCSVSAIALESIGNSNRGRFNCPIPSSNNPLSQMGPVPQGATANYMITDVAESDGNLKLVTFTF